MGAEHSIPKMRHLPSHNDTVTSTTSNNQSPKPMTPSSTISSFGFDIPAQNNVNNNNNNTNSIVTNGVTGKFISQRLVSVVAKFWKENIEILTPQELLEISCSIFFGMLSSSADMKRVMKRNFKNNERIETMSLKYLNMMGWLIRHLERTNIDLHSSLKQLGALHGKMGIKIIHFAPMIQSLHETLSYYYPKIYGIEIQYAMDSVMTIASQIMTGESLSRSKNFLGSNTMFLDSLEVCLSSSLGSEYFYRYLRQNQVEEIAVYLHLMNKFKLQISDNERYSVAKDIVKTCIDPNAEFAINISGDCRQKTVADVNQLKSMNPVISSDFFSLVEMEMRRLIIKTHWRKFKKFVVPLHNSMDCASLIDNYLN